MIETEALVIGAGPVGLFQAFQLGLLEIPCHIVDALPAPGGQCRQLYADKPIYDIPGLPRTTGAELALQLMAQLAPLSPGLHFNEQVQQFEREADGRFALVTRSGLRFLARTVFIAAGVGAFVPRRLTLEGVEAFEGSRLFYHPDDLSRFAGQHVLVHGGDDDALRTALGLKDIASQVSLLHRRDVFNGNDDLVARLRAEVKAKRIDLVIGQPTGFDGQALRIAMPDGSERVMGIDAMVVCLGISPRLGPIADWGLAIERKQLPVDTQGFQTSIPGVFAVGDVNTYPGKRKLIVCGFHEATLAAWAASEIVFPGRAIPLQYTTTSTRLHQLLGVGG